MKPFSLYHLFNDHFSALQAPLVETIVKTAAPDAIFLLGASVDHRRSESIFRAESPTARHVGECTVLVLLPELHGKGLHDWQEQIEVHCHAKLLPLTALVVRTDRFEDWLREKERFAINVRLLAPLLYDAGRVVLPVPNGEPPAFADKATQKARAAGLLRAGEFLAGAELFQLRKQWGMAAFLLHQSAEQSLLALVKTGTGFAAHTHSLERLVRYAALVSYRVADLFPQRTEKDKRLFRLLQKAYIDSRYEDYAITEPELACLLERVKALHQVAVDFGKEAAARCWEALTCDENTLM